MAVAAIPVDVDEIISRLQEVLRGMASSEENRAAIGRLEEIINLQPKGGKAKAYQVKQVRNIILRYRLGELHE